MYTLHLRITFPLIDHIVFFINILVLELVQRRPILARQKPLILSKATRVSSKDKRAAAAIIGTVPGQRGNPKLVLNGYTYIPNKRVGDKTYWSCSLVRQKKCKARLITVGSMDNIFVTTPDHTHEAEIRE